MTQVETININGVVFDMDGDAFVALEVYLNSLSRHFEHMQGGEEIIADIEARIVELFTERQGGKKRPVTIDDVRAVTDTLGTLSDIADTDEDGEGASAESKAARPPRRLYRNLDDRIIGGVASGFAKWLGINVVIIRLVFIVAAIFTFMASVPIYLVLWIIIPPARTTRQKLEMLGQPVNISNIEKSIRTNLPSSKFRSIADQTLGKTDEILRMMFEMGMRFIRICSGVILCAAGVGAMIFLGFLFFAQEMFFYDNIEWELLTFSELLRCMVSPSSYAVATVCAVLFAGPVILACFYWGIRLIMGLNLRHRMLHVTMLSLWLASIPAAAFVCFRETRNYIMYNEINETVTLSVADTIFLNADADGLKISNNPAADVYYDKDNKRFYGKVNVYIGKSSDNTAKLYITRTAHGRTKLDAYRNAENILFDRNGLANSSAFVFPAHFAVEPHGQWRFQELRFSLYLPENTRVVAGQEFCNSRSFHPRLNCDHVWVMTDKGLKRVITNH
jgi:phage shock protein PspC (stress-responsive transcriptional regulator)